MPPQGASGFSGYSGKSGYSGFSGKQGLTGQTGAAGLSGFSGYSGPQGPQGIQGLPGLPGGGTNLPTPNDLVIAGSLTTGSGSTNTGDIAFVGAIAGAVHLTVSDDAGTGIFYLPNTTGSQTIATLADLAALEARLTKP